MNAIEIKNLSKVYDRQTVLNHINLNFEEGKIIGLLGPNGSGKSTLIKLLNGLIQPNSGEILIYGKPVGIESKKLISYLPERTYLNQSMNALQCVAYFKDFYEDFDEEKALAMFSNLGIDVHKKFKTLSKGTKEKIQLILVMSRKAKIYILDEPIAGVDPASRDYILKTIMNNYATGATLIICTHLIQDIEDILDHVIFLSNGELVLSNSASRVKEIYETIDKGFREVFRCL